MSAERPSARSIIEDVFRAALAAVEPRAAVQRAIGWQTGTLLIEGAEMPVAGRLAVVAVGKAAERMARGAYDVLGEAISDGIILTKHGHSGETVPGFSVFEAAHPVPDERGVAATKAIVALAESLGAGDVLLALISGGGSALLEAPRDPVTLADLQRTTELLLRVGAPIQDLNAVRSELSLVKGGGLRRATGEARCVSLILSDVLGNDPTVIASGPTVARRPSPAVALEIISRYGLEDHVPRSVRTLLEHRLVDSTERESLPDTTRDLWHVVGDNDALLDAAVNEATRRGLVVEVVWRRQEGEAAELALSWVERCGGAAENTNLLLGAGEATVTVRGDGRGGRNTEFALAAAIALADCKLDWTVASLASDGDDGAADAAGAVVDRSTVAMLRQHGIDPRDTLHRNDSATALGVVDALVRTGPTGTNVNDLYLAVRSAAIERLEERR